MIIKRAATKGQPAPWLYLWGVTAWTWATLSVVAYSGQSWLSFPNVLFMVAGGLGPVLVSCALVAAGRWDPALDESAAAFLRRALDPRTLPWRWYLGIVGLALALAVGPSLVAPTAWRERGLLEAGPGLYLLVGAVAGAVEEPGWRGYAQEGLQRRMPVLAASLVIGLFWAAWHLPLFAIPGTYQAGLGVRTPAFWAFMGAIVVGSPVYSWLYNATGRVSFAPLLYHALTNVFRELLVDAQPWAPVAVEALLGLLVVLLSWRWMRRRRVGPTQGG